MCIVKLLKCFIRLDFASDSLLEHKQRRLLEFLMLRTCVLLCDYITPNGKHLECRARFYSADEQRTMSKKYGAHDVEVITSSAFSAGSVTSHQLKLPFARDGQIESAAWRIPLVYRSVLLRRFCANKTKCSELSRCVHLDLFRGVVWERVRLSVVVKVVVCV